jgi:hypothetical protein
MLSQTTVYPGDYRNVRLSVVVAAIPAAAHARQKMKIAQLRNGRAKTSALWIAPPYRNGQIAERSLRPFVVSRAHSDVFMLTRMRGRQVGVEARLQEFVVPLDR